MTNSSDTVKLLGKFLNHDRGPAEKLWMQQQAQGDADLQNILAKLQVQDIHILAVLQEQKGAYSIKKIPGQIGISQSNASRSITRLVKHQLIKKFHPADNSKEFVISLTITGQKIAEIHQELQQKIISEMKDVLKPYSTKDVTLFNRMLTDIINANFFLS